MSKLFFHQEIVGMMPPPKPVPGDGAGIRYRRSQVDLSLSHGEAVTRVGVDYIAQDGDGTAEMTYAYPLGTLVLVAANRALPVEFLRVGMTFLLEDGGLARITKVDAPRVWEAPSPKKDQHGTSWGRVLGTVKYTGNFPHFDLHFDHAKIETTPGHRFWCVRRKDWIPASEFKAGDLMRSRENRPVRVRSVSGIYWQYGSLYNVEVEDFHNYFVGDLNGVSVWSHNGLPFGCRVPKAAVVEAIENGELSVVTPKQARIVRPDRHHIFPQQFRQFFKQRGINIDRYTLQMDNMQGAHGALHYGGGAKLGGGWWNDEIMRRVFAAEAGKLGGKLSRREILAIGAQMRRAANLKDVKVIGYYD